MVGLLSPWRKAKSYKGYRPASMSRKQKRANFQSRSKKAVQEVKSSGGLLDLVKSWLDYLDRQRNGKWMIFHNGKPERRGRRFRNYDEFRAALEEDIMLGRIGADVNVSVRRLDDVRQVYYGS